MGMLTYYCEASHLVVVLEGEFDALAVAEIRPELEQIQHAHAGNVIVDLSKVSFIDSSGIGALVFLYKRLVERGSNLALLGVKGQPSELLHMLRIDRVILIYPDLNTYMAEIVQADPKINLSPFVLRVLRSLLFHLRCVLPLRCSTVDSGAVVERFLRGGHVICLPTPDFHCRILQGACIGKRQGPWQVHV